MDYAGAANPAAAAAPATASDSHHAHYPHPHPYAGYPYPYGAYHQPAPVTATDTSAAAAGSSSYYYPVPGATPSVVAQYDPYAAYQYYGPPSGGASDAGLSGYYFAGEASQQAAAAASATQVAQAATGKETGKLFGFDPQRYAQVWALPASFLYIRFHEVLFTFVEFRLICEFFFFHVERAFQRIEGLSRNCSLGGYIARWMISCASIVFVSIRWG